VSVSFLLSKKLVEAAERFLQLVLQLLLQFRIARNVFVAETRAWRPLGRRRTLWLPSEYKSVAHSRGPPA